MQIFATKNNRQPRPFLTLMAVLGISVSFAGCQSNSTSAPASAPSNASADKTTKPNLTKPNVKTSAAVSGSAYQISPVQGWNSSKETAGAEIVISAKPAQSFAANLNVVTVKAAPGENLESDKAQLAEAYPKIFTAYKQIDQGDTTLGGEKAIYNTASYEAGTPPRKLWIKQVFVLKNGKVYTFTCTALDSNHKDYESDFEAMLDSVKWTN